MMSRNFVLSEGFKTFIAVNQFFHQFFRGKSVVHVLCERLTFCLILNHIFLVLLMSLIVYKHN